MPGSGAGGMTVPGASALMPDPTDLESEQERRKRILAQQQSRLMPVAGASALMGAAGVGYGSSIGG